VIREALTEAHAAWTTSSSWRHGGPGLIGALLVGVSAAKALAWARRLPLVAGRPPARPRRLALPRADPLEPPFLCLLASGGHTLLLDVRDRGGSACSARRSTTPPARRSTRARACSGSAIPAAPRSTGSRATATRGVRLPGRARAGLDFSFSGSRRRCSTRSASSAGRARARRADLAARYQRAIVAALVERDAQAASEPARRIAVVGGVAANSELRAALPARARAARALHRQRGDDRLGRAVRRAVPYPGYLGLDAYASTA
jgi:N6-L-threonylcarbamoyladenine synthase